MIDPAKVKAALDAIASGDQAAISAALTDLLAALMAGDTGEAPPATDEGLSEGADPEPDPKEAQATAKALAKLTGCKSSGEAIEFLRTLKASVDSLDADRLALESGARRELVGDLVKLGVELPATAWEPEELDAAGKAKPRKPCKRLADEPIAELRSRVALLRASKPTGPTRLGPVPPTGPGAGEGRLVKTSRGEIMLSASEISNCESLGAKLEAFAENKAIREAAKKGSK